MTILRSTAGRLALPFCLLACAQAASAQFKTQVYELGVHIGQYVYQGDLTPSSLGAFRSGGNAFGITVMRTLKSGFSLRASFDHGSFGANDALYSSPAYRQERNFRFSAKATELGAQLVWSFPGVPFNQRGFSAYAFGGAAMSWLRSTPDASGLNLEYFGGPGSTMAQGLAADQAQGTPRLLPLLTSGIGVKYFFKPQWGVNAEWSYRMTGSDYIDGFSQSANPSRKDHYMQYSIGILYRRGPRISALDCPKIRF